MKKYLVTGRIRADVPLNEVVEASSEDAAVNKAEKLLMLRLNIDNFDILDTEYYAERVKDETT